jgi:hypothetical protein
LQVKLVTVGSWAEELDSAVRRIVGGMGEQSDEFPELRLWAYIQKPKKNAASAPRKSASAVKEAPGMVTAVIRHPVELWEQADDSLLPPSNYKENLGEFEVDLSMRR